MKSESISAEKKRFCKSLTIITDTREQKNSHIISALDDMGIRYEARKSHFGDYSFICENNDFTLSCIIERKANINELWTNCTTDRERFEKEIDGLFRLTGGTVLLIENCPNRDYLRKYKVPQWEIANRYRLQAHCLDGTDNTAAEIINIFYYYRRNFEEMKKPLRA